MARPTLKKTGEGALAPPGKIQLNDKGEIDPSSLLSLNAFAELLAQALTELSFGDGQNYSKAGNFRFQVISFTTPSVANTEKGIDHSLKRRPWGYLVVNQNKAGSLYRTNPGSWSYQRVFFKSDATSMLVTIILVA